MNKEVVIPAPCQARGELQQESDSRFPLPVGERVRVRGRFLRNYTFILIFFWIAGILLGGCSVGKTQQPDLFKEYRKKMEMQKAAIEKEEEKQIRAPEMGPEEHERLGDLYIRRGNIYLAFLEYDKALRMESSRTSTHYKIGRLFLEKGMLEEAGKEFQEILKVAPNDALAHEGMGRVYFKQANFTKAETSFQRAIDLKDNLWQSHHFLGMIFARDGQFEAAISHYRSAVALNPKSSMLYNNLGISLFLKGDYEESVSAFSEALTLENSNEKVQNNLALSLSKLKRNKELVQVSKIIEVQTPKDDHPGSVSTSEDKAELGDNPGEIHKETDPIEDNNNVDTSLW